MLRPVQVPTVPLGLGSVLTSVGTDVHQVPAEQLSLSLSPRAWAPRSALDPSRGCGSHLCCRGWRSQTRDRDLRLPSPAPSPTGSRVPLGSDPGCERADGHRPALF